jgi:hypothetical protein
MKKYCFLLFIVLVSWNNDFEIKNNFIGKPKTDLQKLNLIGKIKSTTETTFKAIGNSSGELSKTDNNYGKEQIIFNKNGNKISETSKLSSTKYEYDNLNNLIKESAFFDDGSFRYIKKFKYDLNNELTEVISYMNNGNTISQRDKYSKENGKIIINSYGGEKNDLRTKQIMFYDNGNLVELQEYDSKNMLYHTQKTNYDKNGNEIEVINSSTEFENYIYTLKQEYNKKNDLIVFLKYKPNNTLDIKEVCTYKYDSKGNWIVKTKNSTYNGMTYIERNIEYL